MNEYVHACDRSSWRILKIFQFRRTADPLSVEFRFWRGSLHDTRPWRGICKYFKVERGNKHVYKCSDGSTPRTEWKKKFSDGNKIALLRKLIRRTTTVARLEFSAFRTRLIEDVAFCGFVKKPAMAFFFFFW